MNNDWVKDYLMHHGILGQKWGVRRYQNADGSLTEKGRKRYRGANGRVSFQGEKAARRAQTDEYKALKDRDASGFVRAVRTQSEIRGESARSGLIERELQWKNIRDRDVTSEKSIAVNAIKGGDRSQHEEDVTFKIINNLKSEYSFVPGYEFQLDNYLNTISTAKKKADDGSPLTKKEQAYLKEIEELDKHYKEINDAYEKAFDKQYAEQMAPHKERMLRSAKDNDEWNLDFLEAVQNEDWTGDSDRMLKEYERFIDAGGFRGYRRDLREREERARSK